MQEDTPATCMHTHTHTRTHMRTSLPPSLLNLSARERSLPPKLSAILLDLFEYYRVLPLVSTLPYTPPEPFDPRGISSEFPASDIHLDSNKGSCSVNWLSMYKCGSPSDLDGGLLEGRTISYSLHPPLSLPRAWQEGGASSLFEQTSTEFLTSIRHQGHKDE